MSNGRARVSVRNRWLSTIWNASPALTYSRALSTARSKFGRVKFDSGTARAPGAAFGSMSVSCRSATPRWSRSVSSSTPRHAAAYAARRPSPEPTWACATTSTVFAAWSKITMRS
jgi:hypothetical protein